MRAGNAPGFIRAKMKTLHSVIAGSAAGVEVAAPAFGRKSILLCFSEEERERFWGEADFPSELAERFDLGVSWLRTPLAAGEWERTLLELRPEVILGAWSLPPLAPELLARLPEFRYLCYFCGAIRAKVPREFIVAGGLVTNWGGLAALTVAECALALVLAAARRVTRYAFELHADRRWSGLGSPAPVSLHGRRVGIHGLGAVARHCLRLLRPFEVEVECWSGGVPDAVYAQAGVRKAAGLEALIARNDIVIEAEALTPKTEGSVTREMLCRMKPGSIFVNVGRGSVLARGAVEALAERGDVAIGLDVYSDYPLPADSPLLGLRHVTLTPHTAGPTLDQYADIRRQSLASLERFLSGQDLPEAIDAAAYDRMT